MTGMLLMRFIQDTVRRRKRNIRMVTGQGGSIIQAMTQVLLNGLRKEKSSNSNGSLILVCVSGLQMRILRTCVFMHTGTQMKFVSKS